MEYNLYDDTPLGEELKSLYRSFAGSMPDTVTRLAGAGSDRSYYRLSAQGCKPAVGVIGMSRRENEAFIMLARMFAASSIPVPDIYGCGPSGYTYLQQDLGDTSLSDLLGTPAGESLIERCMRELPVMQTLPDADWADFVTCRPFDKRGVLRDLNYFKYEFMKPAGIEADEDDLDDEFERFAEAASSVPAELCGFMYRDCQSRNVMVEDDRIFWIDFQGGRRGPCVYDAVSMLWQAKASFSDAFRAKMLDVYASSLASLRGVEKRDVLMFVPVMAALRTLQVLGAYGFRGLVQHKAHFVESIPYALENLKSLIDKGVFKDYPVLELSCRRLCDIKRFSRRGATEGLTVEIFSFSYKNGYPSDLSGNGGGFMFDCRGMHNPGRYEKYRGLTGLDAEVKEFLEERGEVQDFCRMAEDMVAPSVARYAERGFTSLQVGFGCTGGQHRSVYCAERLATSLAARFPEVTVRVTHREQGFSGIVKC